jgi:hypothetical protein
MYTAQMYRQFNLEIKTNLSVVFLCFSHLLKHGGDNPPIFLGNESKQMSQDRIREIPIPQPMRITAIGKFM